MKTSFSNIHIKYVLFFIIFSDGFLSSFSDASVYFSKVPPSVIYVQTGKTARFEWEIENNLYSQRDTQFGTYSPTWYFKNASNVGIQIAYDWKRTSPPWKWTISPSCPARYLNPTRVSKQSTANLIISNITLEDDEIYLCSLALRNPDRYIDSSARLIVTVSPQFNPQPPLTKNIIEGQELSVLCTTIGPPTPNTTWVQINGHVVISTGTGSATLRIPNIRRDQNGTYECQARNNPNEDPVTARTVVAVYYPPHSTITPPSLTVVQGDEIVLNCTADGYPPPSISWTKADGVIKAGHTVAGGTLRIPNAIKTDASKYICTAKNTYDSREHTDSATVTVLVKYQPSITLDKLKNQTLNQSESLSIKCDADGYPPPTIKWKTPTGSVHNGNVYNIPSVSRSHAGTYTCIASNGIGTEAMAILQVTVQYPPDIDTSKSSLLLKSWNGKSIHLKCFATGLPTPRISWYKSTNQQITTGVNIVPEGSEVTVLTTVDQGDYGQYTCRATNILGSDEHVINVTQLFPPSPVNITITEVEASSITVRWTRPADNSGSAVTGYKVEVSTRPPVITVNTHVVITGLKANTQYTVKAYARNIVGYGVASSKIIRTKKQGKPAEPRLTLALDQANGLLVKLSWTKPDDNGGEITNYTIYMKEDGPSELKEIHKIFDPQVLEYGVKKNLEYGKTYKFLVTAWNKYGESAKQEELAKTIDIPKEKAKTGNSTYTYDSSEGKISKLLVGVGVIAAILVASLILNILQFLYIWKAIRHNEKPRRSKSQDMENRQRRETNKTYDNVFELNDKSPSPARESAVFRQTTNSAPEYEAVHPQQSIRQPNPVSEPYETPGEPSCYQELSINGSTQDNTGPVYEPLRTVVPLNDKDTNMYQPLGQRNQSSDYQSLFTNGSDSVI